MRMRENDPIDGLAERRRDHFLLVQNMVALSA
jgi:hypothetical protein